MAVILRWCGKVGNGWGYWVALCAAAKLEMEPGDIYIDDAQDHALRKKYFADFKAEGLIKKEE